ncbi:hypothetical protein EKO04_009935 [Ascochyta lentis]|uniref:Uncharacterized protein n=1 Tax=Ascochyta lentis TaxID=205686 RepID=A0A8H7IW97_9PLEO|nr:hypothetical protein EKO04_009935 [Ascochyta lentis]
MTVFIWSLQSGRRVAMPPAKIEHGGKDDLFQGLFTSFAPYNWNTAFAIASQKNAIITHTWTANSFHQSLARGYHILHLLVDIDDRTLLAFGVDQTHNLLHLLTITGTKTQEEASIKTLAILPGVTQRNIASAAVTLPSPGNQTRRFVLITTIVNGSVRLFRILLDPA